jgi:PRC-barrel domain protein
MRVSQEGAMKASNRVCLLTALAAIALSAFAAESGAGQTGAVAEPPAVSAQSGNRENLAAAKQRDLESVLGREIRTRVEEDLGRIVDLLADRDGHVRAAVIEFGGFMGIGTRKIAVEWPALRFESEGKQPAVILEMTRDQLRRAPEYKPNEPAVVRKADK